MLGVKSNRNSVKGAFADKLREQIITAPTDQLADKVQTEILYHIVWISKKTITFAGS